MPIKSRRGTLFAAATAMGVAGLLAGQAPAQAGPTTALAPPCAEYEFPSVLQLNQDNGITVQVPVSGSPRHSVGPGKAMYAIVGKTVGTFGTVYGGMKGNRIEFTAHWDQGPGAGITNTYAGQVGSDGFASGTTRNNANATNTWRSSERMPCVYKPPQQQNPPPPPQNPPPKQEKRTATVTGEDVDVYNVKNEPEGSGQVIGILRVDQQVELVGDCAPESWCQVAGENVPGGNGWVWGHLKF
ncbi:hypothetical protein [Streptomyces sp. NPDC047976]|uniref:hypothetical protein n=1 Tax=Streptomyces sp. NPDC047976 TaxID=3155746 RepID=UPI003433199F